MYNILKTLTIHIFFYYTEKLIIFFNMQFIRSKEMKTIAAITVLGIAGLLLFLLAVRLFAWDLVTDSMNGSSDININIVNGHSLFFSLKDHPFVILIQLARIFTTIILPTGLLIGSYYKLKSIKY